MIRAGFAVALVLAARAGVAQDIALTGEASAGASAFYCVPSADGARFYVSDPSGQCVNVVSTSTAQVVKTIPFPGYSPFKLFMNPAKSRLYVTAPPERVFVIDTTTDTAIGAIAVPPGVAGNVAFSPAGQPAAVYVLGYAAFGNKLCTADPNTLTVTKTLDVPFSTIHNGFTVTPDNKFVLFTSVDIQTLDGSLVVVDTASFSISAQISTGGKIPWHLACTGNRAFVANYYSSSVAVINLDTLTNESVIPVAGQPFQVMTTDVVKNMVWVVSQNYGVQGIDAAAGLIAANIPLAGVRRPYNTMAVRPDGRFGVVASTDAGTVSLLNLNPASAGFGTVAKQVQVSGSFGPPAFSPDGKRCAVGDRSNGKVWFFAVAGGLDSLSDTIDPVLVWLNNLLAQGGWTGKQTAILTNARDALVEAQAALVAGDLKKALEKTSAAMKKLQQAATEGIATIDAQTMLATAAKMETYIGIKAIEKKVGVGNSIVQSAWAQYGQGVALLNANDPSGAVQKFKAAYNTALTALP